ncbi:unnamed protein product [Gongylonema pulchrum]|uniref:AcidPPc domain-containing protein n=1 Tax=Gongylonema pulchrum TaxID=637853 RepID=A0A183EDI6_9BILA|nr:unnamed protein product [Gongylonema pulchrum]
MQSCTIGSRRISCCEIFEPVFVLLRGRCMRLKPLYQIDNVESSVLSISILTVPSYFTTRTNSQPQVILYIADGHANVPVYPHYYVNENEWTRILFRLRKIVLLPTNKHCIPNDHFLGRAACFISQWLSEMIAKPYNCTLAYLQCQPACSRSDLVMQKYGSPILKTPNDPTKFLIEASYFELQYELYEEVVRTTLPGFISQIGGQFGLFLGVSIITVVEMIVAVVKLLYRAWNAAVRRKKRSITIQSVFSLKV